MTTTWHTELANAGTIFGVQTVRVAICDENRVEIARTSGLFPADEEQVHAAFIVAACNSRAALLAALEELFDLLEEHLPNWYLRGHYNHAHAAIEEAKRGCP